MNIKSVEKNKADLCDSIDKIINISDWNNFFSSKDFIKKSKNENAKPCLVKPIAKIRIIIGNEIVKASHLLGDWFKNIDNESINIKAHIKFTPNNWIPKWYAILFI